jgi:acetylornithine deacetylase
LIQGGQELSSYPERCLLALERRTIPGETPDAVEAELGAILERLRREDPAFRATLRRGLDRIPLETPEEAPIVGVVRAAAEQVLDAALETAGVPYWTDAATLWSAGIPSVLFGPGGAGAHAVEEWVDLESVRACAQVYLETARRFCQ